MNTDIKNLNTTLSDNKAEVDLLEILFDLWKRRKLILLFLIIMIGFGFIIAFTTPKEYSSQVRLLPEISDQKGGASILRQFGNLGNLTGFNFGLLGSSDAINPNLYPEIVKSTPFLLKLMKEEFMVPRLNKKVSLYEYLLEYKPFSLPGLIRKYTIGLPGVMISKLRMKSGGNGHISDVNSDLIQLSPDQFKILLELQGRINGSVDKRNGIVTISVQMPDALHAAILTEKIAAFLTEYITSYRIEKAILDFNFINDRHKEAELNFLTSQERLSAFRDENKNIISAKILSEEERLQSEYNLAFNLYNSLSLELEQARISVQKETPVFKVLSPAEVPILKSKPKKAVILIASFIIGILLAFSYIILETIFAKIKSKYIEKTI